MTTKIISIPEVFDDSILIEAAHAIKQGRLVVFPTETVYGLGANATDPKAASEIYRAKGRPSDNPLIIHIADPRDAEEYTYTNETYYKLAKAFMPGPLTVVLKAKSTVPQETRASLPTVAVRCPSHPVARALIRLSGVPIAAPSANISGSPSATKAEHVIDDMKGRVDYIIDGGDSDIGLESTIIKIEDDGSVTMLRPGKITAEEISGIVGEVKLAAAVTDKLMEGEKVLSPGMKYKHYAPKSPLFLLDGDMDKIVDYLIQRSKTKNIAVICYSDDENIIDQSLPDAKIYVFGNKSDELTQAHLLFDILRLADKENCDEIYAPLPQKHGIGLALYNRMIRAAAYQIIRM